MADDRARPGDDNAVFQDHRGLLLGVAYRMLGSLTDAEDIVQEAWLRWFGADRSRVEAPDRYLVRVVTRLALDRIRATQRRRETYAGPWLPEPVLTGAPLGPAETVALRDSLSVAMLRVMQRLSASERAVFVLREAFELPYDQIGDILGLTDVNARQIHRRAAHRLADDRDRFTVDPQAHRDLVNRFLSAAQDGNRNALEGLLAGDVTLWSDGGGRVSAALRPVSGAERVARFVLGTLAKQESFELRMADLNGQAALLVRLGAHWQACSFESIHGRIIGVQWMANPDKLERSRLS